MFIAVAAVEKRPNILTLIMIFLFVFITLSTFFEIPLILYLIPILIIVVVAISRFRKPKPRMGPPDLGEYPFRPRPNIGRWIIIPLLIIGIIAFIFFANWWLDVKILTSMYFNKAGIDWWKINFFDNYYFYACIAIGLLIALSDPRIKIEKDIQGKRKIYLHSKFWALVNILSEQLSRFSGSQVRISGESYGDRIPLKRGLLWKLAEFLFGTIVIGPLVAGNIAQTYLMIANWIEAQQITWAGFIQSSFSVLYTRLFSYEAFLGQELGAWLIANSPVFEFLIWIRTPVFIIVGIWSARLIVSAIQDMLERRIIKFFRNIVGIGLLVLIPYILQIPTQAFDVTTPFLVRTIIIAMAVLFVFFVFLSLNMGWVQLTISRIFRNRIILFTIIIIVSASLLSGPLVVAIQYAPAMQGRWKEYVWEPKYLPNVVYTRWATGLESIKEDDIDSAINTGTNLEILRRIRVFNDAAAKLRLKPDIGVNWMDFPKEEMTVDVIYANNREYWVAPLTIVLPPGADQWRSSRLLITHSERILAIDAASGEIVQIESVFNLTKPYSIYYGEEGLFKSSQTVYIDIPDASEIHLPGYTSPATYNGEYDYVLDGFERSWFFSGLYGRERLAWDFGRGDFGPVKMLFLRDIEVRLSEILMPGMTLDSDPYLVSDGSNIYYSLYVYIDRDMPTEYLDYPSGEDNYWRVFATILVDAYDGTIQGYLLGNDENNYILDFYRDFYSQWNKPVPEWLTPQLRYPEFLFERQIDSYNLYHVSNPDFWQQSTDFFEETTDSAGNEMEDVRYVIFHLNGTTYWAAIRLVEFFKGAGKNLAGMYVALNGDNLGDVFLLRTGNVAVIGPQTALDTINNYGPTKTEITLHPNWRSGNILMYVINNRPYYFIPYYGETETTLAPAMIVVVDADSQKVGYYAITDPGDPEEVGLASEKAYLNLIGATVELPVEARKKNVLDEFERRGYTVKTPQLLAPSAGYQEKSVSYYGIENWTETNSTISSFISSWVEPYSVDVILMGQPWGVDMPGVNFLNFGVLIDKAGIDELHFITVAFG